MLMITCGPGRATGGPAANGTGERGVRWVRMMLMITCGPGRATGAGCERDRGVRWVRVNAPRDRTVWGVGFSPCDPVVCRSAPPGVAVNERMFLTSEVTLSFRTLTVLSPSC